MAFQNDTPIDTLLVREDVDFAPLFDEEISFDEILGNMMEKRVNETSPARSRKRARHYKATSVALDGKLSNNVIGWQLACAALGKEGHELKHAETFRKRVREESENVEKGFKKRGRSVAEKDGVVYKLGLMNALKDLELVRSLHPRFSELNLEKPKLFKDILNNFLASIDDKWGGDMYGIRTGRTVEEKANLSRFYVY